MTAPPHVFAARFWNVGLVVFDQPRDGRRRAGQCRRGRFEEFGLGGVKHALCPVVALSVISFLDEDLA